MVFEWPWFSAEHYGLAVAVIDALVGIIVAWRVRPIAPTIFTYFITAAGALAAGYGVPIPDQLVPAVNVLVVALIFALTRQQQTPVADPVPTAEDGTVR
jgi:hypothetical protein